MILAPEQLYRDVFQRREARVSAVGTTGGRGEEVTRIPWQDRIVPESLLPPRQADVGVPVMRALFRGPAKTFVTIHGPAVTGERVEPVLPLAVTRYGSQGHTQILGDTL